MKLTLLVVGNTVEKHYITAINDYVEPDILKCFSILIILV